LFCRGLILLDWAVPLASRKKGGKRKEGKKEENRAKERRLPFNRLFTSNHRFADDIQKEKKGEGGRRREGRKVRFYTQNNYDPILREPQLHGGEEKGRGGREGLRGRELSSRKNSVTHRRPKGKKKKGKRGKGGATSFGFLKGRKRGEKREGKGSSLLHAYLDDRYNLFYRRVQGKGEKTKQ